MADKNKTLESTEPKALVIHGVVVPKGTFYCYRETSRNERCDRPCMTDGKCGWNEPQ